MKYYTFTGRSMNSLLRLQGSTSSLYFDFDRYRAWQGEVSRQLPWDCLDRNLVFWCDTTHTGPHDVEECDALRDCVSMVGLCTSALIAESTSSTNERVRLHTRLHFDHRCVHGGQSLIVAPTQTPGSGILTRWEFFLPDEVWSLSNSSLCSSAVTTACKAFFECRFRESVELRLTNIFTIWNL